MYEFLQTAWRITVELAPSLFLGLALAGLLNEFLPKGLIRKHLSGRGPRAVMNAVMVGVPMPLCSCGVVPTAIGLRRQGASDAATTGFLISTPQTGVDSILVSATFLGWPFALFKVAAALVTGLLGGVLVGLGRAPQGDGADAVADAAAVVATGKPLIRKIISGLHYAIFDLLASIDLYLLVGIFAAALISTLIPTGSLGSIAWTQGIGGMGLALLISLPLYVCTTASVPIATSLIAAGMPLGTALVFLMAGPATNVATIGAVYRGLGRRVLVIYVGVVAAMSVIFGLTFDWVLAGGAEPVHLHHHEEGGLLGVIAGVGLLACITLLVARRAAGWLRRRREGAVAADLEYRVRGMTCRNCAGKVEVAVRSVAGVEGVEVFVDQGLLRVAGRRDADETICRAVRDAGYEIERAKRNDG
ncbi:MAG: permease [Pseudomonadota bacterium]